MEVGVGQVWSHRKTRRKVYVNGGSFGMVTVRRCYDRCTRHPKAMFPEAHLVRAYTFVEQRFP
ncbi:MAG: hypothetical protein ACRD1B_05675 [Thermoanaerobaculia bacterium]